MNETAAKKSVYLDYNATTPLADVVIEEIKDALIQAWGNPSSSYREGIYARNILDKARKDVADCINAPSDDIIFTSGGTESNNWVINAATQLYKSTVQQNEPKPHVIISTVEHDSISIPLKKLHEEGVIELTKVPIDNKSGIVQPIAVANSVKPNTCLVSVMMANNETGVIMPIKEIVAQVREKEIKCISKVYVHTDAAQTIGKTTVNVQELNVDFLTIVGHKFYGPRIGALYIKDLTYSKLKPFLLGGGQEKGWRAGTENTPMIAGLGRAAKLITENLNEYRESMLKTRNYLELRLKEELGERIHINCEPYERLPNTCNVSIIGEGLEGYKVLQKARNFSCSTGSACHTGSCKPSKILTQFHIPSSIAANAIRLSTGRDTTIQDIDVVVQELCYIVKELS